MKIKNIEINKLINSLSFNLNNNKLNDNEYFLSIAKLTALRSRCFFGKKHGAVLVRNRHIISLGYNGPAYKEKHCKKCSLIKDKYGKDWRTCPAIHAEENAIFNAIKNNINIIGCKIYITKKPCDKCLNILKNINIKEIIYEEND
jgi:dCMP deaminase